MKILFDHGLPFALAHGGFQQQIIQTMAAVAANGVEVEHVRWWDEAQRGDIIHYFGRPGESYIDFAHGKGIKVIVAELHSGLGSRSDCARFLQKALMRASEFILPKAFTAKMAWGAYRKADAFVANTSWEAHLMKSMFSADPEKIHIIPNGVESIFARPHQGGKFLVCTAAIDPRKRMVELARAAIKAQVPLWLIGKPYSQEDAYFREFLALQQAHAEWVRYEGPIVSREKLAEAYAAARGFVLLSTQETLSLSAAEATAAGCPLLLSDLPWARSAYGTAATYVSLRSTESQLSEALRKFYETAPLLSAPSKPPSWKEVGALFVGMYESVFR